AVQRPLGGAVEEEHRAAGGVAHVDREVATTNTSASMSRSAITNRSPAAGFHSSPASRSRRANSTEIMPPPREEVRRRGSPQRATPSNASTAARTRAGAA